MFWTVKELSIVMCQFETCMMTGLIPEIIEFYRLRTKYCFHFVCPSRGGGQEGYPGQDHDRVLPPRPIPTPPCPPIPTPPHTIPSSHDQDRVPPPPSRKCHRQDTARAVWLLPFHGGLSCSQIILVCFCPKFDLLRDRWHLTTNFISIKMSQIFNTDNESFVFVFKCKIGNPDNPCLTTQNIHVAVVKCERSLKAHSHRALFFWLGMRFVFACDGLYRSSSLRSVQLICCDKRNRSRNEKKVAQCERALNVA